MKIDERISKLNRVGIALSAKRNLDELLDLIVLEARNLTGADAGSLYLREGEKLYFKVSQNRTLEEKLGSRKAFFQPFTLKISKNNFAGYVATTSKPLNIPDAYSLSADLDYRHSEEFDKKFDYKTKSILTVPMIDHKNKIIGILQLINAKAEGKTVPFKSEDEDLVMSLASQAAVAINNANFIREIEDLFKSIIKYSVSAIDARSPYTAGHSERVATLATRFAEYLNQKNEGFFAKVEFSKDELEELQYAAWLHDIGKIGVKEIVLDKRNKLSDENVNLIEFKFYALILQRYVQLLENRGKEGIKSQHAAQKEKLIDTLHFIKRINIPTERMNDDDVDRLKNVLKIRFTDPVSNDDHPVITEQEYDNLKILRGSLNDQERKEAQSHVEKSIKIIEPLPFKEYMKNIPDIVSKHHEYLDGSGYPKGVKADEIPLQARMLCVVDIFDALVAKDRPYKKSIPIDIAYKILRKDAEAGKLDKEVVELFIESKVHEGIY